MKADSIKILKESLISTYKKYGDDNFIIINGKPFTGNELAKEIEDETELGLNIIDNLIQLTVDLLKRDKINMK